MNSYRSIQNRVETHLRPFFAKRRDIRKISTRDILSFKNELNKSQLSTRYKQNLFICLSTVLNFCMKYYNLKENVARKVGNFKSDEEITTTGNIWTIDEFNQFIEHVDDIVYKSLFNFLFFTGCRISEALAIRIEDVDFENSTIYIKKNMTRFIDQNHRHIETTTKTKKSMRKIYIDSKLRSELHELIEYYKQKYKNLSTENFLFGYNKVLSTTTIERRKNKYCKSANVKQIKIHEFRHSHACLLFMNNVPIDEISYRLGHSNIEMTMRVYLKYLPKKESSVIATLDSLHYN